MQEKVSRLASAEAAAEGSAEGSDAPITSRSGRWRRSAAIRLGRTTARSVADQAGSGKTVRGNLS